jgi:hypothetical protein
MVWTGCIWVSMGVSGNQLAVSRSGYGCDGMGIMYLDQDMGVSEWAGCI